MTGSAAPRLSDPVPSPREAGRGLGRGVCVDRSFNQTALWRYHRDVEDPRGAMTQAATGDDQAMVAGCRAGEATSLERFFVTHVRYVERVISRLTGPTPDLEDLVQTTFIQAFQSFGRYRGEASLKTCLLYTSPSPRDLSTSRMPSSA